MSIYPAWALERPGDMLKREQCWSPFLPLPLLSQFLLLRCLVLCHHFRLRHLLLRPVETLCMCVCCEIV